MKWKYTQWDVHKIYVLCVSTVQMAYRKAQINSYMNAYLQAMLFSLQTIHGNYWCCCCCCLPLQLISKNVAFTHMRSSRRCSIWSIQYTHTHTHLLFALCIFHFCFVFHQINSVLVTFVHRTKKNENKGNKPRTIGSCEFA